MAIDPPAEKQQYDVKGQDNGSNERIGGMAFLTEEVDVGMERDLHATKDDILEAQEMAARLSMDEVRSILRQTYKIHKLDPHFPVPTLRKIEAFLNTEDLSESDPKHAAMIEEMKIEAALISTNSPYAEVRAVVDGKDDPTMPAGTIRAWTIGTIFSIILPFVNQLFSERYPAIQLYSNVAQLLSFPVGKAWEKVVPDIGFNFRGSRISLNPGPFNKKEHMLITIMARVASGTPYTTGIILIQYLPTFYNQKWAGESFGYQILLALSTNFIGYGMAGICRRFLVYPSYCVWPLSLVTVALNSALHKENTTPVLGPFKKMFHMSRLKFFYIVFTLSFCWFWFPNFIFPALSLFSWISWIDTSNQDLTVITGTTSNGLGVNPLPTFDWNIISFQTDPFVVPFFTTISLWFGAFITMFGLVGMWYTNALNTGYLPINSNHVFDNTGAPYNTTRVVDENGMFDAEGYYAYSPPFMTAGSVTVYTSFFGIYSATVTYAALYHRHEIALAFRMLFRKFKFFRRNKTDEDFETAANFDVHHKLMRQYKEAPEWWYTIVLLISIALGVAGISGYDTHTSPFVVFYGIILCAIFIVPIGIITAVTGIQPTLNVLAEFIGGSIAEGNMLAMNYFKTYGVITAVNTVGFSEDLKLGHYLKIPPRQTFMIQMVGTLISTFICIGVMNFQIRNIPGICTEDAAWKMICPGTWTFYTASVLWGTIGPKKIWGVNGYYSNTLLGFPVGVVLVVAWYLLQKKFPRATWMRQFHPVSALYGALIWAPYNMSFINGAIPLAYLSWIVVKRRYLAFWARYNYVLSAALTTGVAISGFIQFWAVQYPEYNMPEWWGVTVGADGCLESETACLRHYVEKEGDYFGPRMGEWN